MGLLGELGKLAVPGLATALEVKKAIESPAGKKVLDKADKVIKVIREDDTEASKEQVKEKPLQALTQEEKEAMETKRWEIENRRIIIVVADDATLICAKYPQFKKSEIKGNDKFKFPPNHPVSNTAYATSEMFPDTYYFPLSGFHNHLRELKHGDFVRLCIYLGAREVSVENVIIDNENIGVNGSGSKHIADIGFNFSKSKNSESEELIAFSFSEENKGIKEGEYKSPWLATEPTWQLMAEARRSGLKSCSVEFNYCDDMGINAELEASIKVFKVSLGGSFESMKKLKLKFRVEFW